MKRAGGGVQWAYLDVHEVVHARSSQLGELQTALFEERGDIVSLLCLERMRNGAGAEMSGGNLGAGRQMYDRFD